MPDLPGRAAFLHRRQHLIHRCVKPRGICLVCGRWRRVERLLHHGVHGVWSAEHVDGLGKPCRPLLGQAAWFVFGCAGFQGGLLGQLQ
jgi:hypothetical protein